VQVRSNTLVGVDAQSGRLLWQYGQTAQDSPANIPTPVAQDGYVYSAASRSGGGLVKLNQAQEGMSAEPVYFSPRLPSGIGGTVLLDGHLYGTNGQVLLCTEFLTGDIKWQERGIGASSVCYADGRLYLHGENGDVALVEPSTESYQERGRFSPPNPPERGDNRAWTHPVVANGKLYIRELQSLWSFDIAE
jgi:outer membrane protein assembly factor BamB